MSLRPAVVASSDSLRPECGLRLVIEQAWEERAVLSPQTAGSVREAVDAALDLLDSGVLRVAEPDPGGWRVHEWLKKAVLLSFRLNPCEAQAGAPDGGVWWDKVPSKCARWSEEDFERAGFRAVPGAIVRRSAFVGRNVVLMPCFVNVGARIDEGTMIDTWSTVGSCAQIGKDCHISGGVGIGGVLEPLQAAPVIVEDGVFVGARSEIAEGVVVEKGAVISMGVFLGASTKIVDRQTSEVFQGRVPAGAVVVPGSLPGKSLPDGSPGPCLSCAVIVKRVDARTRAKTSVNEILRD
jgi:2,3,4,5-tetrahydropyridine-2-carboxylate N-succinyltransferase